jgi:hypothetical protein
MQAIMRAKRVAPDARLTLAAIKVDDRHEYGRGFVYAIASIIDAIRIVVASCPNKNWHESAPARRLQACASCGTILNAKPPDPEPAPATIAMYRAQRAVNIDAIKALAATLDVPLDELAVTSPEPKRERDPAHDDDVAEIVERLVRRAQYLALREVLIVLDSWREGARSNHDGMGHQREIASEECWENFHASDVRTMVADAARELRTADPNEGHAPADLPALS